MRALAATGASFLLAVLWFDLMFDVQARRPDRGDLSPDVLASISAYYARVTTGARPMNRLVAFAMVTTIGSQIALLATGGLAAWRSSLALALTTTAVVLAVIRTVPNAVRLGASGDDATRRSILARGILRDHVACFVAIAAVLALVLLPA